MMVEKSDKIFLLGFMGAGKSTVASIIADHYDVGWLDTDDLIENMVGCSIPEIFEKDGERTFREIEYKAVERAIRLNIPVIALGGGAPIKDRSWRLIQSKGLTFYLEVEPKNVIDRIKGNMDRPLLESLSEKERLKKIKKLLAEREYRYEEADFKISTDDLSPGEVAKRLIEILENLNGKA